MRNDDVRQKRHSIVVFAESSLYNTVALSKRRIPYYAIEELAGKFPNEVIVPFKVERINEVLDEMRKNITDNKMKSFLRLIEEGLTYSDVLVMMKWYKVLPR